MADTPLSAVIRQVHSRIVATQAGDASDAFLLDRFQIQKDSGAFEALIRRHGPMVLGVCRRVLRDDHDAEDAFQATFLVLFRKVSSIRRNDPLANWLHGVAYFTATRLRNKKDRFGAFFHVFTSSSHHSTQSAKSIGDGPAVAEANELKTILDAELKRLPEKYRAPLLLCYLQGKTKAQAAHQLGWPEGTVSGRLARGREMLRNRLIRHGLTLSASMLAVEISDSAVQASQAVVFAEQSILPAYLITATVEAVKQTAVGASATGVISTSVTALTQGVVKAMFLSKLKFAAAMVSTLAIASAGVGVGTYYALAMDEKNADEKVEVKKVKSTEPAPPIAKAKPEWPKEHAHPITVSGTATERSGKAIKGATIYLASARNAAIIGTATTDEQGRYLFKDAPLPILQFNHTSVPAGAYEVYGKADGFGFTWQGARWFFPKNRPERYLSGGTEDYHFFLDEPMTANLVFGQEAKLKGRLVDETGKPISKAKILLESADFLDITGREPNISHRMFTSIYRGHGLTNSVMTNEDGRFRMDDLPVETAFWLYVLHPDYARVRLYAATTDRHLTERVYTPWPGRPEERLPMRTGELNLTLIATRQIDIQVHYADTGKPAPRAWVFLESAGKKIPSEIDGFADGTTDSAGKLQLRLPPGEFRVRIDAPRDVGYVRTEGKTFVVAKEPAEQKLVAKLNPGCILVLEAVDADTGKGIANVDFGYREEAEEGWHQVQGSMTSYNPVTDATGILRVVVYPGKRSYRAGHTPLPQGYQHEDTPGELLELAAGKTVTCQFKLRKK